MIWCVTAFLAVAVSGNASLLLPLVLRWLALVCAMTALCWLLLALGCGAPGERVPRRR